MDEENDRDNEFKTKIEKMVEGISKNPTIEDGVAQKVGEYLYYHTQVENSLDELITSLIPEIDIEILNLDSFKKKVSLIRSLTPNSTELAMFNLLDKLNNVRNVFAHENPKNINYEKINAPLINLFKQAFLHDKQLRKEIESIERKGSNEIPVMVIKLTNTVLNYLVEVEKFGKKEDVKLRSFESLRKFSSLYVRRRFSILVYQFQTGVKSDEAPDNFKQVIAFNDHIAELKDIFTNLFKKK